MKTIRSQVLFLTIVCCLGALSLQAQSSIDAWNTTYVSGNNSASYNETPAANSGTFTSCSGTSFAYSFNNGTSNLLKLLDITTSGKNFFIANGTLAIVKLRRANNAAVSGNRSIISMESTLSTTAGCPASGQISLKTPYQDVMENFLNTNYLNQGTDNIFTNSGNSDGNNNNIERVDVIFPSGLSSSSAADAGFGVFDRGTNNNHDGFRIAAIANLDVNSYPSAFGTIKTCVKGNGSGNGSWGHPSTTNGNKTIAEYVLRKEENETQLKVSAAVNQQIGGVFFSFADLGITAGQTIYGYSVFPLDGLANPTSAQLLNINDVLVYPTNTTETNGGLDMMAVNAVFQTSSNPLASHNIQLTAKGMSSGSLLTWKIPEEDKNANIVLERSGNGNEFRSVYSLPANEMTGNYLDPYKANAFYRLKMISSGNTRYSDVVAVRVKTVQTASAYPTIIHSGQCLNFIGVMDGKYKMISTSVNGEQQRSEIIVINKRAIVNINFVVRGLVFVQLINDVGNTYRLERLVIQ